MYSSNFVFSKLPQTNAGRGHRFLNPKQTILFLVFLPLFVPAPPNSSTYSFHSTKRSIRDDDYRRFCRRPLKVDRLGQGTLHRPASKT